MADTHHRRTLTIKELNKATGLSISTLRRRVKDGTIPVIQAGGHGKKLLFPASIIDELCTRRSAQPGPITRDDLSESENVVQCPPQPAGECVEADPATEKTDLSFQFGGVAIPEAGPIPNWMRSPLLKKCNFNKANSKK